MKRLDLLRISDTKKVGPSTDSRYKKGLSQPEFQV